ncbi:MAG: DNA mismatch repair protein MutS [Flavobacteriales bacterium]|nr:DNA mismatch repair protein MutS [Flavobacteriales bacterium]
MSQYNRIKQKHPNCLLLFRVGDFYETFGNDAIKASNILDIILTNRSNGSSKIELAGFPHHSLDTYLPKLVRAGERVAICEQLEDPKSTKGIVKRGVTELITPGVSYHDLVLEKKKNNFLSSISYSKNIIGISFLDVSTGEFLSAEGNVDYISKLLQSFKPSEIIFSKNHENVIKDIFNLTSHIYKIDEWACNLDYAKELLIDQFQISSLKGFGIENKNQAIIASGIILHYLKEINHNKKNHILSISRIDQEEYVWMDKFTMRNLEIFSSTNEEGKSLIDVLDYTKSAMGGRLLRRWLALPLKNKKIISKRHKVVSELINNDDFTMKISEEVLKIGDLERLISKASTFRINPRECEKLKIALSATNIVNEICKKSNIKIVRDMVTKLNPCLDLQKKLENELSDNPPILINKGNVIKSGVNTELDHLRDLRASGKLYLQEMLTREIEKTGISSLKISFNNVFGYYLEVRNTHKDKVPEEWIRKQTLVSSERYITEELKEYEEKIFSAEERINLIENKLYEELVNYISEYISSLQKNAQIIAELDCLLSFAFVSEKYNYCCPIIDNSDALLIKKGRHPVIEQQLEILDNYISNDLFLDREKQQIMMITGPNMSGKSALLRQTALIVLMAQIGCFVPAESAEIGLVDKIFTRVGASDNISMGESTFMVEMLETASIINNLSSKSLVLLDEIGRGTSTYDGVSIAWSIAEYLHENHNQARTLFATHYHELNKMEAKFKRIKNYNVAVKEINNDIIFIRKLQKGGSEHSFGIHVAKMAGLPKIIIDKANKILHRLESYKEKDQNLEDHSYKANNQLSFVKLEDPILEQIRDEILQIDVNKITPVDALMKINEIKKILRK